MQDPVETVKTYVLAWNEVDPNKRRRLLSFSFIENGTYVDNINRAVGREALSQLIGAYLNDVLPRGSLAVTSKVDTHDGFCRFNWSACDEVGREKSSGTDFVEFSSNGQINRVVGFLDSADDVSWQ